MSRSFIKSEWIKKKFKNGLPWFTSKKKTTKNPHKFDEMPKNKPSKEIQMKCPNAEWLQEPSNFKGHKTHTDGHRMVSGIVRAKTKREINDIINESLEDFNPDFDDIKLMPESEDLNTLNEKE